MTNANSFDIPLQNVSFTVPAVEVPGPRRLGEGATGPFTLVAGQTVGRTVPVVRDDKALLEAALVAVRAGQDSMTFRVEGTVTGSVYGIVAVNAPFGQERAITLQEMGRECRRPRRRGRPAAGVRAVRDGRRVALRNGSAGVNTTG